MQELKEKGQAAAPQADETARSVEVPQLPEKGFFDGLKPSERCLKLADFMIGKGKFRPRVRLSMFLYVRPGRLGDLVIGTAEQEHECGSAACVAGWACLLDGKLPQYGRWWSWTQKAAEALGIPPGLMEEHILGWNKCMLGSLECDELECDEKYQLARLFASRIRDDLSQPEEAELRLRRAAKYLQEQGL